MIHWEDFYNGCMVEQKRWMTKGREVNDDYVGCLTADASQFGSWKVHRKINGRRECDDELTAWSKVDASKVGSRKVHGRLLAK